MPPVVRVEIRYRIYMAGYGSADGARKSRSAVATRRRTSAQIEAAAQAAAIALLIEGGPSAVTMDAVAARMGDC